MTDTKINADTILNWLKEKIEDKEPIPPTTFVDAASKLNMFLPDERKELFRLQKVYGDVLTRLRGSQEKTNISELKVLGQMTDEYFAVKEQEGRIEDIKEQIRIAKLQGRILETEMKGY